MAEIGTDRPRENELRGHLCPAMEAMDAKPRRRCAVVGARACADLAQQETSIINAALSAGDKLAARVGKPRV